MDVRRWVTVAAVAAVLFLAFPGAAAAQNPDSTKDAAAKPQAGSASQYKIGIVDRRAVLQGYDKVADERKQLESEVDAENEEINKMAEKLQTDKDAYDKEKDSLSDLAREEREMAIQKAFMEYQAKLQTKQAEVDERERRLMKRFFSDIDDAVQKIGDTENYHLIIDGSKGSSTLFYAPALDISQKVIDLLNTNPK